MSESENKQLEDYEKSYKKIREYSKKIHIKNQKRISAGLWCLAIIPVIFLILLFTMKSSKIVYLVFWIVSLFLIAAYLITVEYQDYSMQQRLKELGISEDDRIEDLIGNNLLEEKVNKMKKIREKFVSDYEISYQEEYDRKFLECNEDSGDFEDDKKDDNND